MHCSISTNLKHWLLYKYSPSQLLIVPAHSQPKYSSTFWNSERQCSKKSSMKCGIINLGLVSERFCNKQTVINHGCMMIRPRKRNSHRGTHCNFISLLSSTYNKCWNMLNVWSCAFNKFNKQISSDIPNTGIIRIFFKKYLFRIQCYKRKNWILIKQFNKTRHNV